VFRTTTLFYGNMPFSGTCPAKTPKPIKMKFCTIDYVDKVTRCAENITSKTLLNLPCSTFFLFSTHIAKTASPICTHDGSNNAACCKKMPFRGSVDRI
jgi:hypothetical protein